MEEKRRVWLVVHVICNCKLPLLFSPRATRPHCNFCFLFPSHPLPSSFTFAPLFTFGYPRSPHPSFFGFHVFILAQRSSLSWTGSAEMRKPGAQQEKGECANSTLASDGSLSLDSCRCYYSFHLLLRLLFFLRGQSSIQFPHYGWKPSHYSPGVLKEKDVPMGLINVWTHRSIYTSEN